MNRKVLFMCLMVLFLGMMAGSAFAQVELLTNTGFEDGINPLAPPWWNQNSWGQGSAGQAVDGVEGPTGTRSGAKMWQMSGAAVGNTNGNCVEQGPVFEAWAGTFNGSAWVRVPTASVDNPVSVGFRFWLGTTANGYLFGNSNLNMTTLTTGDWTEITCSVVASTPCTQAYFDVKSISNPDTSMITYVDDASITITQYAISGAITLDDLADPTGTVVTCSSGASTIVADSSGDYSLLVGPGTYTVTASKALYTTTSVEGVVVEDEDVLGVDIELPKVTTGFISGTITDESGPVAGIIVTASDFVNHSLAQTDSAATGVDGLYTVEVGLSPPGSMGYYLAIKNMPVGKAVASGITYPIDPESGYPYGISPGATDQNFVLGPLPPLVDVNLTSIGGGDVTSIPNTGSLGGNFVVDGTGTAPAVTAVGSMKAIAFNLSGTTLLLTDALATPKSVLGLNDTGGAGANPVYTILATVYRTDFVDAPNGCVFASFAPYRYGASFCYGNTPWIANHWMAGATMVVDNPTFYDTYATAGSWHTLLFTSDGSSENLYIDGATTPVATTSGPTSFHNEYNNNRYPIRLGGTDMGDGSDLGWLYNGAIGSLQIWDIPTAAADVPAKTAAIEPITAITHTITASAETGGAIDPSGAVDVLEGSCPTYTITAITGYKVKSVIVNDVDQGAITSYTFPAITQDMTIVATFETSSTCNIVVTQGANGTISPDPAIVNIGANLTFTITANSRYQIADVVVDGNSVGAVSSYTFENVTDNTHTISATFAPTPPLVNVDLTSIDGGSVTSIQNTGSLGGDFMVDGTGTAPVVRTAGSKKAVMFNISGTTLLLNGAAPTPNSVLGLNGSGGVGPNPVYTILATVYRPDFDDAPGGCMFASFAPYRNGASFCYGNTPWIANHWTAGATMTVDNPTFYDANAPAGSWHTLLFTSDGSSEKLYIDGAAMPVATTTGPTSFYNEYNINRYPIRLGGSDMGDGTGLLGLYSGAIGSLQIWDIAIPAEDVPAATAAIAPIAGTMHTITATAEAGKGAISPSGAALVDDGGDQTFTITPDLGYAIDQVLVDGLNDPDAVAAGSYTFTNVTGPHTISVTFAQAQTWTIAVTQGANGTISPDPAIVNNGASLTLTITSNPGYQIADVLVDGASVGAIASYTFTNVTANHTISATFALALPAMLVSKSDGGGRNDWDGDIGYRFTTGGNPASVTKLGFVDWDLNGLLTAHQVGIWNLDGSPVASTTVPAGIVGELIGDFRYANLAATVTLSANTTYVIGAETFNGGDVWPGNATPPGFSAPYFDGFVIVECNYHVGAGFAMPESSWMSGECAASCNLIANIISPPAGPVYGVNNKAVLTDDKLIGKRVKVWGKIIGTPGATYTISDGYSAGVTINGATTQIEGDMVVITGVVEADHSVTP